jgi:hypothetical protein
MLALRSVLGLLTVISIGACASDGAPSHASGASSSGSEGDAGGSATASTATASSSSGGCSPCSAPTTSASVAIAGLTECSGLASSAIHPGVAYAHNDSGDAARFFAFDVATGEKRGEFALAGVVATDWEDMARGPCSEGSGNCLYFGDFGDNDEVRDRVTIARVAEPIELRADAVQSLVAEIVEITYPDGPHDAETLLVHPVTGDVTLVTKSGAGSVAYELRAPLVTGSRRTAERVGDVLLESFVPLTTGGDVHPKAESVLLRTYTAVLLYLLEPGERVGEALGRAPCVLEAPIERQGEAIAWTIDGAGWFTVGESSMPPVFRASCP